jgi:osmotically-inducible protein OsmY
MLNSKLIDRDIGQHVAHALSQHGLRSPCHIDVSSLHGVVTLKGMLQYEFQRHTAIRCVRGVSGVRRVIDQLSVPKLVIWR